MEIDVRELDNDMAVIEIDGEIDIYTSSDLKDALIQQIDSGTKHIIMDLENVTYIDSSGIGVFISTLATLKKLGGKICIIKITDSVKKVFELTKLTNFFKIYKNEEEAVSGLLEE